MGWGEGEEIEGFVRGQRNGGRTGGTAEVVGESLGGWIDTLGRVLMCKMLVGRKTMEGRFL